MRQWWWWACREPVKEGVHARASVRARASAQPLPACLPNQVQLRLEAWSLVHWPAHMHACSVRKRRMHAHLPPAASRACTKPTTRVVCDKLLRIVRRTFARPNAKVQLLTLTVRVALNNLRVHP